MSHWSSGYITEIGYTRGYYPELNPARTRVMMALAGLRCPEFATACELGFGQGVSCNIHAAGGTTSWYGNDFNPGHVAFSNQLATAAAHTGRWSDDSFEEFLARTDLPQFDYIVLHGIWSWVSAENRKFIVEFLRTRLKTGGVVYISYNTLPGWSAFAPMRKFIHDYAHNLTPDSEPVVNKVKGALGFASKFHEVAPAYRTAHPHSKERLDRLHTMDSAYVAHEYLNESWEPMYFSDLAREMQNAKLDFACSANYLDMMPRLNFSEAQLNLLNEFSDPLLVEGAKDFIVNQQFRREYWVRGAQKLGNQEKLKVLADVRFLWISHLKEINYKFKTALGEITMSADIYKPAVDLLTSAGPMRYADISKALKVTGLSNGQIDEVLVLLCGGGYLTPVQSEAVIEAVRPTCERLNSYILDCARENNEIGSLVSPVTGGGVPMNRFQQLFLLAAKQGNTGPAQWVEFVWNILKEQGQKLVNNSKTLITEEDNKRELLQLAESFEKEWSQFLVVLQLLEPAKPARSRTGKA